MTEEKRFSHVPLINLTEDEIDEACFDAKDKAWVAVVDLFDQKREVESITYQSLADRIGRKKTQVHRWVDSSSNMTLQSLGLIAAGMDATVSIKLTPRKFDPALRNYCHPAESAAEIVSLRLNRKVLLPPSSDGSREHRPDPHVLKRHFSYQVEDIA